MAGRPRRRARRVRRAGTRAVRCEECERSMGPHFRGPCSHMGKRRNPDTIQVVPAYGRDHKSAAEVQKAWAEGKDFRINEPGHRYHGSYINKEDADNGQVTVVVKYRAGQQNLVIQPSRSNPGRIICPACDGDCSDPTRASGVCGRCGGEGVVSSASVKVKPRTHVICPSCHGNCYTTQGRPCSRCKETGMIPISRTNPTQWPQGWRPHNTGGGLMRLLYRNGDFELLAGPVSALKTGGGGLPVRGQRVAIWLMSREHGDTLAEKLGPWDRFMEWPASAYFEGLRREQRPNPRYRVTFRSRR